VRFQSDSTLEYTKVCLRLRLSLQQTNVAATFLWKRLLTLESSDGVPHRNALAEELYDSCTIDALNKPGCEQGQAGPMPRAQYC
ncbi:hypothetical protein Tco_0888611, partial [Tanacetum coccineum]